VSSRRCADQHHYIRGVRTSTANNAPEYGFTLSAAGSFAALQKIHGAPSWLDLFLFLVGGCVGFAVVNAVSTLLFREESPHEPELVISIATPLSIVSVCASVAAAIGVAYALPDWAALPVVALAFTLVYVAGVGAEIGVAARQHPAGGVEGERRRRRA
jgi:succinate dehydrogenase/fumarate reductase cytochrome b subunit